jgi:predicted nucleotidyltransferase
MKRTNVLRIERKFYTETAMNKIFEVLFNYPEKEFSLSDLAEVAGVAKGNIGKILDTLYKDGIIEIEKLSKIWRIRANQKSQIFLRLKIIHNLISIYQSYFGDTNFIDFLNEHFKNPKSIIIFGSFIKGEDISSSDIDIAIEADDLKGYKTVHLTEIVDKNLRKEVMKFEEFIGRKIQIHLFNRKNIDLNLFNNIANGIVLSGFLEVKP